jgi:prevent-host-death family protein
MLKQYAIAEARNHFTTVVREVEQVAPVEFTRRGQPVAVLMSIQEYRQLRAGKTDFWDAYTRFREKFDLRTLNIPPETFANLRDQSPGRDVDL